MMKKLCTALQQKRWLLPVVLYVLALVGTLVGDCVSLAIDTRDKQSGLLAPRTLTVADFTLVNAVAQGETVTSTNEDPQMLYGPADIRLDTLTLRVQYDKHSYERCLYYTTAPGEAFGQEKRVWPVENADGSVTFSLPAGVVAIRLDPGSRTDLVMRFDSIVLNSPRTVADYFLPSGGGWFALLALPGLAAAVLQWLLDMLKKKN